MIQRLSVAPVQNLPQPLTYQADHPQPIEPGTRVLVPLGKRVSPAWVVGRDSGWSGKTRSLLGIFDDPFRFDAAFMQLMDTLSRTYLQSQGLLLESALPQDLKAGQGYTVEKAEPGSGCLAVCRCRGAGRFTDFSPGGEQPKPAVYDGPPEITGPRRLEQLQELAGKITEGGGSLLTLAGDAQTIDAMAETLPGIRAYHSKTPAKERRRIWQAARDGEPQWIIGGVSAALLPVRGLSALIIVDAHNPAHFSRFFRDYGAAHIARLRSRVQDLPLICSSPAPTPLSRWFGPFFENALPRAPEAVIPAVVKPARWDRPEALERLGKALLEEYSPERRSLYVLAAPEASTSAWCPKCRRRQAGESLTACPGCNGTLKLFPRPSVPWLQDLLARRCENPDPGFLDVIPSSRLSRAGEGYDRIVLVGPESWISLDEVDGALRMWALLEEMRRLLAADGELLVHSAFHFHYSLQLANDPAAFFEREISYRKWFRLPPLCAVYQLDFRHRELRTLGGLMRRWSERFRGDETVRIDQVRLLSRRPVRGLYKGSLVFHGRAEQIWESGLFPERNTSVKLVMG